LWLKEAEQSSGKRVWEWNLCQLGNPIFGGKYRCVKVLEGGIVPKTPKAVRRQKIRYSIARKRHPGWPSGSPLLNKWYFQKGGDNLILKQLQSKGGQEAPCFFPLGPTVDPGGIPSGLLQTRPQEGEKGGRADPFIFPPLKKITRKRQKE